MLCLRTAPSSLILWQSYSNAYYPHIYIFYYYPKNEVASVLPLPYGFIVYFEIITDDKRPHN